MSVVNRGFDSASLAERVRQESSAGTLLICRERIHKAKGRTWMGFSAYLTTPHGIEKRFGGLLEHKGWFGCFDSLVDQFGVIRGAEAYVGDQMLVWTEARVPFRAYWGEKEHLRGGDDGLHCGQTSLARGEIAEIQRFASENEVTRGVRAVTTGGQFFDLATDEDESPLYDMEYDYAELLHETRWADAFAGHLAAALGVPYVDAVG